MTDDEQFLRRQRGRRSTRRGARNAGDAGHDGDAGHNDAQVPASQLARPRSDCGMRARLHLIAISGFDAGTLRARPCANVNLAAAA
jgi:hypothetical protein